MRIRPPRPQLLVAATTTLLVITALAACGSSNSDSTHEGATLKINYFEGNDVSVVPWVGAELGIFKDNGVDVTLVPTSGGPATISALLSGDLDLVTTQLPGQLQLVDSGQNAKAVVGIFSEYPYSIVSAKSVPTTDANSFPGALRNLKGTIFGVDAIGGVSYNTIRVFMEEAGLNPDKDVKFVAIGNTAQLAAALQNGQIDAFNALPTDVARIVTVGGQGNDLIDLGPNGPDSFDSWLLSTYYGTDARLAKSPKTFRAFQAGWKATVEYMLDPANADKVIPVASKFLGLDESQTAAVLAKTMPAMTDGSIDPKAIETVSSFVAKNKLTKTKIPTSDIVWSGK